MAERRALLVAASLALASLALFWPGYAMYDTVAQYGQVLSGHYADWHPPVMARLWAVLAWLLPGRGAAPMLVVPMALYWFGLGLLAGAAGGRTGAAVLAVGVLPPFLGWQGVVLKDAQLVGALLGATGLVAWWRLRGRRMPVAAGAAAALLLGYAVLVRANAVFAAVPLVLMLARWPRALIARAAVAVLLTGAVLAVSSPINHRLLGAERSGVERTEALYDLSGIAVRAGPGAIHVGLTPAEIGGLRDRACVRPYFWDPLGDEKRCNGTVERLRRIAPGPLYRLLADAALHHPLAYAAHRLAHLNSTTRWLVPLWWPGAAPPVHSEANDLGLVSPAKRAAAWQRAGGWIAETPLGWPVAWAVLAIGGVAVAARRAATPRRDLALALLVSALSLEASFAVLSIASDLRYHLWPMIATALGTVLLLGEASPTRREWLGVGGALLLAVAAGGVARAVLPTPPQSYVGMLGP